uniref:Uncharacterized protein n=1 Tax=Anopheles atroparvus TaxID=41427 RepID=A0A182ISW6_ANOAO
MYAGPLMAFQGYQDLMGSRGISTVYVSLVSLSSTFFTLSPKNVIVTQAERRWHGMGVLKRPDKRKKKMVSGVRCGLRKLALNFHSGLAEKWPKERLINRHLENCGIPGTEKAQQRRKPPKGPSRQGITFWHVRYIDFRSPFRLRAVAIDTFAIPTDNGEHGGGHHQHEQLPHLGQRNRMVACVGLGEQRMGVGLVPDTERAVEVLRVDRKVDELRDRVREEQRRDGVGRQLVHVVRVGGQVAEDGEELQHHHGERPPGVHLADQYRPGDVAKQEVAAGLHEPNVRHQVGDQPDVLGRLDLHLDSAVGQQQLGVTRRSVE